MLLRGGIARVQAVAAEFTTIALALGVFGLLLLVCALLGKPVERFGVPIVFVFLGVGMLAGSEGIGGLPFDDYRFAFQLGTAALVLILLDGGLNTSLHALRGAMLPALVLATAGVGITAILVAGFALQLGVPLTEAVLLGAIVSSTDAAAVFAVLRGGNLRLAPRIAGTIELESGVNDPMAVILTLLATAYAAGGATPTSGLLLEAPIQLGVGLAIGCGLGFPARWLLVRVRLSTAGLYPALTVGLGMLAFGIATLLHGSGFLAVFAAAVVLGNGSLPYRNGLRRIHDALAWLAQVAMFLMLGLLVFPSQLRPVALEGLWIALFLCFVGRPLAAALCLAPFGFSWREIVYIGWVGLRGAVAIILATFPVVANVPGALHIFNVVFFVVVVSSLLQGTSVRWLTRRLGLVGDSTPVPPALLELNSTRQLRGDLVSYYITPSLAVCGASLAEVPFPPDSGAVLVIRGGQLIAARGPTVLNPGDHVYVFSRPEDRPLMELLFGQPQDS
jgi:potassium/hydrogen antiporter